MRAHFSLALLLAACGATGDMASPSTYVPSAGAGPFTKLAADPSLSINAPFVLRAPGADLGEPSVIANGSKLTLWVSVTRTTSSGMMSDIERATADSALTDGFGALTPVLAADQPWEMGALRSPSIVAPSKSGEPWLLFYAAGGAIGYARSTDGVTFTKVAGPQFIARESAVTLDAVSATRVGEQVFVFYVKRAAAWREAVQFAALAAAELPTSQELPTLVVGNDALFSTAPWANSGIGHVSARAVITPAGRVRHDVFFDAEIGPVTSVGWAAAFEDSPFSIDATPVLIGPAHAPTVVAYGDQSLCLYVDQLAGNAAIGAATGP